MKILDACCGSRMFWFDEHNPDVTFMDIRSETHLLSGGNLFTVKPDIVADFRNIPFPDETFDLVVFDPPHLHKRAGENMDIVKKYGRLGHHWKQDIKAGFEECMRVLQRNGFLVFKWSEREITVRELLKVIGCVPLFGHKSGKRMLTHWMMFSKTERTPHDGA